MTDTQKVCCMFSDPVPGHAVDNRDLMFLVGEKWSRKEYKICRCKRCGAYVLYKYEENVSYGGWDNVDIDEVYYPIEDPTEDGKLEKYPETVTIIKNARSIHTDYREEDWKKDRSWRFSKT